MQTAVDGMAYDLMVRPQAINVEFALQIVLVVDGAILILFVCQTERNEEDEQRVDTAKRHLHEYWFAFQLLVLEKIFENLLALAYRFLLTGIDHEYQSVNATVIFRPGRVTKLSLATDVDQLHGALLLLASGDLRRIGHLACRGAHGRCSILRRS